MISFILVWLTISTDFYWGWWSAFSIFRIIIIQWSSMVLNLHRRRVRLWKQREVLLSQRSLLWSRHGNTDTKERWNLSFRWNAPSSGQRGIMISLSKIFQLIATKILYQIYNTIWESKILTLFCFPYFSFANCLESDQGPHQYLQYLRLHHRHNQCHQLLISEITNICPLGNHTGVWLWFNISVNHCH